MWYGRGIDVSGASRTVFMDSDHIVGYPDQLVHNPPLRSAGARKWAYGRLPYEYPVPGTA